MTSDLEMHFGKRCYVGVSKVENDHVNVCGLFETRRDLGTTDKPACY